MAGKDGEEASDSSSQAANDEGPSSSQMTDMFKALMGEMKAMSSNINSFMTRQDELSESEDERSETDDPPTHPTGSNAEDPLRQLIDSAGDPPKDDSASGYLKDIAKDLNIQETTDTAINDELAKIFQTLLKDKMPEHKLKSKVEIYVRPENVELRVPKVNPLIWNQLASNTRAHDARLQKSQGVLVGALIANVKAANIALTKYGNDKELLTLLTDSVAMGLQFYQEVNHSRRVAMKPDLHKDYASLCNVAQAESTEFLFGDVSKLTKDIAEANKLTKRVRQTSSRGPDKHRHSAGNNGYRRYQPYHRGRKSADFLSRDHPRSKKKKDGKPSHQQ